MSKKLYAAYGSNMHLEQMATRCPGAVLKGVGEIEGYEVLFRHYATIEPKEGATVPIAIWEIDSRNEKALDRYEGYPTFYRKEMVKIKGQKAIMAYVMNEDARPYGLPPLSYLEVIRTGYGDVNIKSAEPIDEALNRTIKLSKGEN